MLARNPSLTGMSPGTAGNIQTGAGVAGNALGIYSGLKQGGVVGNVQAGVGAAGLATKAGFLGGTKGALGSALGYAGPLMGLYSGLKQGGPIGYGQAALSGYQLGNMAGLFGSSAAPTAAGASASAGGAGGAAATGIGATLAAGALAAAGIALPIWAAVNEPTEQANQWNAFTKMAQTPDDPSRPDLAAMKQYAQAQLDAMGKTGKWLPVPAGPTGPRTTQASKKPT